MRYYLEGHGGSVLLSDQVVVQVKTGDIEEMIQNAKNDAYRVAGRMPDFAPYTMDDGCGLLEMTQGNVYAFRPYEIISDDPGDLAKVLPVRFDTLEACEECEIIAVVYYDSNEQK